MHGEQGPVGGVGKARLHSERLPSEGLILEGLGVREGFLELWPNQTLCLVALDHAGKGCAVSAKAQTILIRCTCLLSRISGNAASDKNIKDGVCAQIEKNFARAKWKVGFGSLSS